MPDSLASPFGNRGDVELSSSRADSQALAATTTARQRIFFSERVPFSTYETAVTRPLSSVTSSRAMAPVITRSLPVFIAGKIIAWLEVNADAVWQPRPHCPQ